MWVRRSMLLGSMRQAHRRGDGYVLWDDRRCGLVYWYSSHLNTWRGIEIMIRCRRVGVIGLLSDEVTVIAVGYGYRHGSVMLIGVFRGRIFRRWSSQGARRVRTMLMLSESGFTAKTGGVGRESESESALEREGVT